MGNTYILRKGSATLSDLADGMSAVDLLAAAGGNWYYCDPTNGTTDGDGKTPATANSSLLTVYNLCRDGKNDGVFFIGGATAYNPTAAFTWAKSYTHLIGLTNGLSGLGQRARIVNTAANDLAVLFTLSGSGCMVANIQFFDGKDKAEDGACVLVSGSRNHFVNCFVAGMGSAVASGPFSRAGSYSLTVSGEENEFTRCTIGLDTVARTAANSELIVSGARNLFSNCDIRCQSTTAGKFLVTVDSSGGDLRDVVFEDCLFFCYTANWAAGINNAIHDAITNTCWIILKGNCMIVGTSVTWADTVTHIYGAGAVPNAGYGIAINPTS